LTTKFILVTASTTTGVRPRGPITVIAPHRVLRQADHVLALSEPNRRQPRPSAM
jgi:hypothetical protein